MSNSITQQEIWNGTGGQGWVLSQDLLDLTYQPLEVLLADAVSSMSARRVLDVGCGTGATTVAIQRRLGVEGSCVGIDLSEVMIDAARARAEREGIAATFVCADAQTHPFEPASVDMVVSRFGVMFFSDPVRAFANLRSAAAEGTRLCCIVWRRAAENPFMTAAEQAAEALLPGVCRRELDGPGQFGLADQARVQHSLSESGWHDVDIAPIDVPCAFPASELDLYLGRLGPVGRVLQGADDDTRARVIEAIRPAMAPYLHGSQVHFTAACWMIGARSGA